MNKPKPVASIIYQTFTAIIGLITTLIGIWVPAIYFDAQANAHSAGGGAGATLLAMFICSPAALFIGPVAGIVGGRVGGNFGKHRDGVTSRMYGYVGGGIAGLVVGVLPYVLIEIVSLITGSPGF